MTVPMGVSRLHRGRRQLREKLSDYAYRSGFLREHPDAATGSPDGAATATKEREEER